jgi:WD40 repeat protein
MKVQYSLRPPFRLLVATSLCAFSIVLSAQPRRPPPAITSAAVIDLQFSPDGRTLAIARGWRDEPRVELWDVPEGTLRQTIKGFDGPVWSISFSPDGRTLVTASGGLHPEKVAQKPTHRSGKSFTELKWWDVKTGDFKQRREFTDEDLVRIVAAYSPDGQALATVENRMDTTLASFDMGGTAASPMPESRLGMPGVYRAAMSESRVELLDAATGDVRLKLKNKFASPQRPYFPRRGDLPPIAPTQLINPPIFSPDGKMIAAWNFSDIKLWSSTTGDELLKLKDLKGTVSSVAFSPDNSLLAAVILKTTFKDRYPVEFKSEIRIWETATGSQLPAIPLSTNAVSSLLFAGNGQQFLVGGLVMDGDHRYASMELVDLKSGSLGRLRGKDESNGTSIRVSPGGDLMAFQTDASTVKLLSTRDWRTLCTLGMGTESGSDSALVRRFLVSVKSVQAVAFLGDGKSVAGEIEGGGIKVWDPRTGELKKTIGREAETGSIAAIAAGGNAVAEIGADEQVRLWSLETGEPQTVLPAQSRASALALSADGTILAASLGKNISLTDARDLKTQHRIAEVGEITVLGLSIDGKLLAAATSEGVVAIWDAQHAQSKTKITAHGPVTSLQFGAQDRLLAVGSKDGTVAVWNAETGQMIFEGRKHSSAVNAIAFSPEGKLLATGSDDRKAIIWEVAGGRARHTLSGHDLAVTSIAFSPDASTLAVGTGNASVVLWQVEKGKLDRVLK